jgi:hypothetical protein
VLRAAHESCPRAALPAVKRFVNAPRQPPELRALATRVLSRGDGGPAQRRMRMA